MADTFPTTSVAADDVSASRLGRTAFRRPTPGGGYAIGGVGGILIALGAIALGGDYFTNSDQSGSVGAILCAGLIIVALVAAGLTTGPPRSAALASLVLTVPGFWTFALVVHHPKNSSFKLSYILVALVFAAIYSIGPARGRAIFLGLALIFGLTWMVVQVQADRPVPFAPSVSSTVESTPLGTRSLTPSKPDRTGPAVATLMIGAVYGAIGLGLDARHRAGMATAFFLVGSIAVIGGAGTLGNEVCDATVAGIFAAAAGTIVVITASSVRRRGTTLIGAAAVVGGVLTIVVNEVDSLVQFGGWAIGAGAATTIVGFVLARALHETPAGEPPVFRATVPAPPIDSDTPPATT
jgi:hypothetical protein